VAVAAGPRPGLVALAYRLRSGSLTSHPKARRRRCTTALVQAPPGTEWNVDGEIVAAGESNFRGQGGAFRLIVA
jgi:diacylglycerol kinase family enzyme